MAKQKIDKATRRRLTTSYISTVFGISLVLFMLGLLGLIILHARIISEHVKENIGVSIIMKDNIKEVDIIQLQKTFDATHYVKSTKYISKEIAARELQEELGEDFISFLGYNPLLPSIEVKLNADYANNDSIAKIQSLIFENANVNEVHYQKSLVHLVNENIRKISIALLGFSAMLLLIAIALVNNTIRLSVYSKRFLIKSMQLIGATQSFIRKPFLIQGTIQGLLSALIAIGMLVGILYIAESEVPELIDFQEPILFLLLFCFVIFLGMIMSFISNFFAVRKFLKIKSEKLYYY